MDETHEPDADVLDFSDRLARIEADVAAVPDLPSLAGLDLPSEADLASEMERRKVLFARDLMNAGDNGVSPDRLHKHTGLSHSWIHQQLGALTGDGAVIRVSRGQYQGTPGRNVWDAMEAIRRSHDELLAEARSA